MFKFDFNKEINNSTNENNLNNKKDLKWIESKQILPNTTLINQILTHKDLECTKLEFNNEIVQYIKPKSVIDILKDDLNELKSEILRADKNHSDLIASVYEGGLKVWDCTYDLVDFISNINLDLKDKNVLDLGCGMGIIGLLTLLKGSFVDFQDYNSDVIEYVTSLNMFLTTQSNETLRNNCRFYSGDWKSFTDLLYKHEKEKYDYIFTSETIYNVDNYWKLIDLFKRLLKNDGKIYLAAKSYYFGVGGGIKQFEDALIKDNCFNFETIWMSTDGINRYILEIVRK